MSRRFDDALNDCLERLTRGEDVEQCSRRYPEYQRELAPLLRTALTAMRYADSASYRPQARLRGMTQVLQALTDGGAHKKRRFSFLTLNPVTRPVLFGFAAVFITLVAAGGTTAASSNSVPGEPLYWVKITREHITLNIPSSDMEKAQTHAKLANARGHEINQLIAQGRVYEAEMMMRRLKHHLHESAAYAGVIIVTDPIEMPSRRQRIESMKNFLALRQALEQDVRLLRAELAEKVDEAPPGQKRIIVRKIMRQSDQGYRVLLDAMSGSGTTGQRSIVIVPVSTPR